VNKTTKLQHSHNKEIIFSCANVKFHEPIRSRDMLVTWRYSLNTEEWYMVRWAILS